MLNFGSQGKSPFFIERRTTSPLKSYSTQSSDTSFSRKISYSGPETVPMPETQGLRGGLVADETISQET